MPSEVNLATKTTNQRTTNQRKRDPKTGRLLPGDGPNQQQKQRARDVAARIAYDRTMKSKARVRLPDGRFAPTDGTGSPLGAVSIKAALEKVMREFDTESRKFKAQIVAETLYSMAVDDRNTEAMKELINRIDGKVVEKHEIENKTPVTLVFAPVNLPSGNPGQIITVEPTELSPPVENPFLPVIAQLSAPNQSNEIEGAEETVDHPTDPDPSS